MISHRSAWSGSTPPVVSSNPPTSPLGFVVRRVELECCVLRHSSRHHPLHEDGLGARMQCLRAFAGRRSALSASCLTAQKLRHAASRRCSSARFLPVEDAAQNLDLVRGHGLASRPSRANRMPDHALRLAFFSSIVNFASGPHLCISCLLFAKTRLSSSHICWRSMYFVFPSFAFLFHPSQWPACRPCVHAAPLHDDHCCRAAKHSQGPCVPPATPSQ